ncbi:hypothetical protein JCM14076_05300 [Methylosoma difficile]
MNAFAHAAVISDSHTASTDYLVLPHIGQLGYQATLIKGADLAKTDLSRYQLVVICRYITTQQLALLARNQPSGLQLVYFMDDDLFDRQALHGLPLRYQWKIFRTALRHRQQLMRICSAFWMTSEHLLAKYAALKPILITPTATAKTLAKPTPKDYVTVCYHGTASHQTELAWLLPIIASVQAQSENIHFELFGSGKLAQAVKQYPRVSVLHPLSWSNYLDYTRIQQRDLGLAPLLPSAFNAARGPTKFFDYARMGAIGIYSDVPPYQGFIRDGLDGCLLANDPSLWATTILQLASNGERREVLSAGVQQRLDAMTSR